MLYATCIVFVLLLSHIAEKKENRFCIFLCAVILSLFCGLRGIGTGIDTIHYFDYMSYIRASGIRFGSDIGFSAISYILMGIFDNPYYPLIIYSAITMFLIVYRLWDFREEASFPLMLLIFISVYYPYTFNIVRQFLAISIIFFATRYIETLEYWKYIIANIIAATIHTSSLTCFSYLFITFGNRTEKKKYKIVYFLAAFGFVFIGLYLFNKNALKYINYFIASKPSIHTMTMLKILCWFMVVFLNNVFNNSRFSVSKSGEYIPMQRQIPIIYVAGLGLAALGMMFMYMNRIGFYFLMYEMPFWGQSVRAKTNGSIYLVILFLIISYVLISNYTANESADNLFYYQSFLYQ